MHTSRSPTSTWAGVYGEQVATAAAAAVAAAVVAVAALVTAAMVEPVAAAVAAASWRAIAHVCESQAKAYVVLHLWLHVLSQLAQQHYAHGLQYHCRQCGCQAALPLLFTILVRHTRCVYVWLYVWHALHLSTPACCLILSPPVGGGQRQAMVRDHCVWHTLPAM